jgi:hypothetical protein
VQPLRHGSELHVDTSKTSTYQHTVLLERINLWWPRALSGSSAGLTAQTSVRTYCLRGWASRTTRFSGLSYPNSQPTAPAVIQGC